MSTSLTAPPSDEVEAILDRRVGRQDPPRDADLAPVFKFLLDSDTFTPANATPPHWYCAEADELKRRAATYLIVLFAFKQQGTSKTWIETLAKVLKGCARCARAFGAARRTWERL